MSSDSEQTPQQDSATAGNSFPRESQGRQAQTGSTGTLVDPGFLSASALSWIDLFLENGGREKIASLVTAAGAMPRKHPAATVAIGMGGLLLGWMKLRADQESASIKGYTAAQADRLWDLSQNAAQSAANNGASFLDEVRSASSRAARSGRSAAAGASASALAAADSARGTYDGVIDSLGDDAEKFVEGARQLRKEAADGLQKVRQLAEDEPAVAVAGGVAGGVALAAGALLLARLLR